MTKYSQLILGLLLLAVFSLLANMEATFAQNYKLKKSVVDQGGAASQSTNYKIVEAIGQPSPVGTAMSTNYKDASGFFAQAATSPVAILVVSPTTLNFGNMLATMTFTISNGGSGILSWSIAETSDKPWLTSFTPASGNGNATVTVTVDRSLLTSNSDIGTLSVSSNGGSQNINVMIAKILGGITWQAGLTVRDAGNNTGALSFGQATDATNDIDAVYGEAELPPSPPTGTFDARFELPVSPAKASAKDYRNDSEQTIAWRIKFQPGTIGAITFSWNSTDLPAGSFFLKDEFTGTLVNVNMKNQNSYTLTNTAITSLKIEGMLGLTTRDVVVNSGWNIISVPLLAVDMSVSNLFPDASSSAFEFNNGYVVATALKNGVGYWLKFNNAKTYTISGMVVTPKECQVKSGWNIIGPFESDVTTSAISSIPSGIVDSKYYGFNNGYQEATTLNVGKGYWVKTNQAGVLHLPGGAMITSMMNVWVSSKSATGETISVEGKVDGLNWSKAEPIHLQHRKTSNLITTSDLSNESGMVDIPLIITDKAGGIKTLYFGLAPNATDSIDQELGESELPPFPPSGIFESRFIDEDITTVDTLGLGTYKDYRKGDSLFVGDYEHEIKYQRGTGTKITVIWNLPKGVTGELRDVVSNGSIYYKEMIGKDSLEVTNTAVEKLKLKIIYKLKTSADQCLERKPNAYQLTQNYPNPFNPETRIEYQLPYSGEVRLCIFDIRGQLVRQLINGLTNAGSHLVVWNGKNDSGQLVASGVYFYRIEVKPKNNEQPYVFDVKKMILMK